MENRIIDIKHRLIISMDSVVSYIVDNHITHIRLEAIYDHNRAPVLIAYKPGELDDISRRLWRLITIKNNSLIIMTPQVLKSYIGQMMSIFIESDKYRKPNELFRIRPFFEFIIPDVKMPKRKEQKSDPYFTDKGALILPFIFYDTWSPELYESVIIDTDHINAHLIHDGIIFFSINYTIRNRSQSAYKLYHTTNGYRTRPMSRLQLLLSDQSKSLGSFEYKKTFKADWSDFGVIVFMEKKV